jgi:hypothetical protein
MKTTTEIIAIIEATNPRSAWNKGVKAYALEILADMPRNVEYGTMVAMQRDALKGARDWRQYSEGGCSLVYDEDIAKRLCTPSELKKTHNGARRPNSREEWLDTQARALRQAWWVIRNAAVDAGYLF